MLIVFDLDHTIWPFRVDKNTTSPFNINTFGNVVDIKGNVVKCYPNIKDIMKKLLTQGYELAIASRIEDICGAYQLLEFFELSELFAYKEIYKANKVVHFKNIHRKSNREFSEMLFFDDDKRNLRAVSSLGVVSLQVLASGVTDDLIKEGIAKLQSISLVT